jgi:hypothetical protein
VGSRYVGPGDHTPWTESNNLGRNLLKKGRRIRTSNSGGCTSHMFHAALGDERQASGFTGPPAPPCSQFGQGDGSLFPETELVREARGPNRTLGRTSLRLRLPRLRGIQLPKHRVRARPIHRVGGRVDKRTGGIFLRNVRIKTSRPSSRRDAKPRWQKAGSRSPSTS